MIRNSLLLLAFALIPCLHGCGDGDASDEDGSSSDTGDTSVQDGELYCHYVNPFTQAAECRVYTGSGWDGVSMAENCGSPMPSTLGELDATACDTASAVGKCTVDKGQETESVTWFYDYDAASLKSGCEQFSHGTWESEEEAESTTSSELLPEALEACKSNDDVTVTPESIDDDSLAEMRENGGHIFFAPTKPLAPATAVIIYPGARIDMRSFAPAAQLIAKQGFYVALQPMPGYMAVGDPVFRADDIIDAHPEIEYWFIAGHSMGGTGAAHYAYGTDKEIAGLIILASYVDEEHDLSDSGLPVLVQVGTQERLATDDKDDFDAAKPYLPSDTEYFFIEGGIHFYFCYSEDPRGEEALITREEQHEIYTSKMINFFSHHMGPMGGE